MDCLSMLGVTHRSAPLEVLEQVAVPPGGRGRVLAQIREAGWREAVVVSTCSRTEVYAASPGPAPAGLLTVLAAHAGRSPAVLAPAVRTRTGPGAVEHLFQVTAGLDSRVTGEVEISGQVRTAFRAAQGEGMTGPVLGQLFPAALRCSRRVREETALGARGASLGRRAVDVGLAALGDSAGPVVVVVGSGRMAATAVEQLARRGHRARVAARDQACAARLAGTDRACPLGTLTSEIAHADLLLCTTSAAHRIVTLDAVRTAVDGRARPLVVVDVSVPRNVDPKVAELPGVRLIDLEGMDDDTGADAGLSAARDSATGLVRGEVCRYLDGIAARRAGPVIAAVRQRVEEACRLELVRHAPPGGLDPEGLRRAAHAVAGRLAHRPTLAARAAAAAGDTAALAMLCDIFGVPLPDLGRAPGAAPARP